MFYDLKLNKNTFWYEKSFTMYERLVIISGFYDYLIERFQLSLIFVFVNLTGDHKIRRQKDGTRLPEPRDIQLKLFLWRSHDFPDDYNYHVNQFGQWSAHDITLLPSRSKGTIKYETYQLLSGI